MKSIEKEWQSYAIGEILSYFYCVLSCINSRSV